MKTNLFKIMGVSQTQLQYSSASTRNTSLQQFMGGAEFNEEHPDPDSFTLPHEQEENLEDKFGSNVCRNDMPKSWGYPRVDRHLGHKIFSIENDTAGWRRIGGEVVYDAKPDTNPKKNA